MAILDLEAKMVWKLYNNGPSGFIIPNLVKNDTFLSFELIMC